MTIDTTNLKWGEEIAQFLKDNWIEAPEIDPVFIQLFLVEERTMGWNKADTGNVYRNYYELVRKLGTLRKQAIIVPDNPLFEAMEIGQCYYNAYVAATELEGYQYVEGYAQSNWVNIVPHAWFEDEDGTIIDPTWAHLGIDANFQMTYFGVKFGLDFLVDRANATDHCSVLGSDWMVHTPILRRGLVMDGDVAVGLGEYAERYPEEGS